MTMMLVAGVRADPESDYRAAKQNQTQTSETTIVEPGADEAIDAFASAPAAVPVPPGRTCPATWLFFSNDVMHYDLCYPAAWGFNDGASVQPMTTIPGPSLYAVQMMSSEAFPWPVGSDPVVAAETRNAAIIDFDVYQPFVGLPGKCRPATPEPALGAVSAWCGEYLRYESGALISDPSGKLYQAQFVVPLPTDPLRPATEVDTTGYELSIVVITSRAGWSVLGNTVLDVVRKIRPM